MSSNHDDGFVTISLENLECEICLQDTGESLTTCDICARYLTCGPVQQGFNQIPDLVHIETRGHRACFRKFHKLARRLSRPTGCPKHHCEADLSGNDSGRERHPKNVRSDSSIHREQWLSFDANNLGSELLLANIRNRVSKSNPNSRLGSPILSGRQLSDQEHCWSEPKLNVSADDLRRSYKKYLFGRNEETKANETKIHATPCFRASGFTDQSSQTNFECHDKLLRPKDLNLSSGSKTSKVCGSEVCTINKATLDSLSSLFKYENSGEKENIPLKNSPSQQVPNDKHARDNEVEEKEQRETEDRSKVCKAELGPVKIKTCQPNPQYLDVESMQKLGLESCQDIAQQNKSGTNIRVVEENQNETFVEAMNAKKNAMQGNEVNQNKKKLGTVAQVSPENEHEIITGSTTHLDKKNGISTKLTRDVISSKNDFANGQTENFVGLKRNQQPVIKPEIENYICVVKRKQKLGLNEIDECARSEAKVHQGNGCESSGTVIQENLKGSDKNTALKFKGNVCEKSDTGMQKKNIGSEKAGREAQKENGSCDQISNDGRKRKDSTRPDILKNGGSKPSALNLGSGASSRQREGEELDAEWWRNVACIDGEQLHKLDVQELSVHLRTLKKAVNDAGSLLVQLLQEKDVINGEVSSRHVTIKKLVQRQTNLHH